MALDPISHALIFGDSSKPLGPVASAGGGGIEGGKRLGRELALWSPPIRSANDELLADKLVIDARSRDASINDPFVAAGNRTHRDLIVGSQFVLSAKPNVLALKQSDAWGIEFEEEVEAKWSLIANSPHCYLDARRTSTFLDLVRLSVAMDSSGGEVLAGIEWINQSGRPIHTAISMIDPDRLSNPRGVANTPRLHKGVVTDAWGAPQGYWIQNAHPNDITNYVDANRWEYVKAYKPWGRPQIIHLFDMDRPEASRGIAKLVSSLKETKMAGKLRDITLQAAVISATYAASIESDLPPDQVLAQLGAGTLNTSLAGRIREYAEETLAAMGEYMSDSRMNYIDGTMIPTFYPGSKLTIKPIGEPGSVGSDYEASLMRSIAASLDLSYEEFTRDLSQSNYSSIKAAFGQTQTHMKPRKKRVADGFANIVYRCVLEEWIETGQLETVPRSMPRWRDGLNAEAYSQASWIGSGQGQLDELKETQAASLRVRYGLSTSEIELGRLGLDWREVFKQQARESALRQKLGLVDPFQAITPNALNAVTGAPREKDKNDEPADGSNDNVDARKNDPLDILLVAVDPTDDNAVDRIIATDAED